MIRFLLSIAAAILLAACHDDGPDFTPIRDGMRAIGFCLVAAATVTALGAIISRNDGGKGGKHD